MDFRLSPVAVAPASPDLDLRLQDPGRKPISPHQRAPRSCIAAPLTLLPMLTEPRP